MYAKKGSWVQIHAIILKSSERADHIPEDTKKVPLEMRVKGFLLNDNAKIGDNVQIKTASGRKVSGKLIAINPEYTHNFGKPIPELLTIGVELRKILGGVGNDKYE